MTKHGRVGELECYAISLLSLLYRYISCSVHCYYCYSYRYCCCLFCCCCTVVLNLSLSQPRGFVFHSLCGGGAAATWSQTPAGPKPPQMLSASPLGTCMHLIKTHGLVEVLLTVLHILCFDFPNPFLTLHTRTVTLCCSWIT